MNSSRLRVLSHRLGKFATSRLFQERIAPKTTFEKLMIVTMGGWEDQEIWNLSHKNCINQILQSTCIKKFRVHKFA